MPDINFYGKTLRGLVSCSEWCYLIVMHVFYMKARSLSSNFLSSSGFINSGCLILSTAFRALRSSLHFWNKTLRLKSASYVPNPCLHVLCILLRIIFIKSCRTSPIKLINWNWSQRLAFGFFGIGTSIECSKFCRIERDLYILLNSWTRTSMISCSCNLIDSMYIGPVALRCFACFITFRTSDHSILGDVSLLYIGTKMCFVCFH